MKTSKKWLLAFAALLLCIVVSLLVVNSFLLDDYPDGSTDIQTFQWAQDTIPFDFYCLIKCKTTEKAFEEYIRDNDFKPVDFDNYTWNFFDAPSWWNPPVEGLKAFCTKDSRNSEYIIVGFKDGYFYRMDVFF